MLFSKKLKKEIGLLLMIERHKRFLSQACVSKKIGISQTLLDWFELGAPKNNWKHYGELLDLYQKDLKIELVDRPKKEILPEQIK